MAYTQSGAIYTDFVPMIIEEEEREDSETDALALSPADLQTG